MGWMPNKQNADTRIKERLQDGLTRVIADLA